MDYHSNRKYPGVKQFIIADTLDDYHDYCDENKLDGALVFYCADYEEAYKDMKTNRYKGIDAEIVDIRKEEKRR